MINILRDTPRIYSDRILIVYCLGGGGGGGGGGGPII